MSIPVHWFALAGIATLINGATLGFIAKREATPTLRLWAWGWVAWALAVIPLAALGTREPHALLALTCGLLWVGSSLCFLGGAYALQRRSTPRGWYAVAALCVLAALALGMAPPEGMGMVPLVTFQSGGLIATGVLIIRGARRRAGAWLCGVALIALGAHVLSAPLQLSDAALMPWGFVAAAALEFVSALGMLMLHYEQAHTELQETLRALEETRRVEALGRVAGGVAHDFNNMLTVMQAHIEFIQLDKDQPQRFAQSLDTMAQAVEQASRLTSQLLAFGRRSLLQPRAFDIREAVEGTLALLGRVMPANVEVQFRCSEAQIMASMDRALLEQIVLNLVTNARDAIAGPGQISVALETRTVPEAGVLLRVVDDGAGMDETLLQRAFEPFFTTKGSGLGTGLGLASVQGAVSQLGGTIRVASQLGKGSTFEVLLPLIPAPAAPKTDAPPPEIGPLEILVVDDDARVRGATARMLEAAGHRVNQAGDGAQALEMVRTKRYSVMLSDVVMPRMGGLALLEEVLKHGPEMIVVLTSGYPLDSKLDPSQVHFLPKPFGRAALLGLIAQLVAERANSRQRAAG